MSNNNYRVQIRYPVKVSGFIFYRMDTIFVPKGCESGRDAYVKYIVNSMRPFKCESKILVSEIQNDEAGKDVIIPKKIFTVKEGIVKIESWMDSDRRYIETGVVTAEQGIREMENTLASVYEEVYA